MNYLNLTMHELHDLYVAKKVTPLEVVKQAISALEKDNHNALEATMYPSALEIAKTIGEVEVDNPLWGIPFLIKDNFSTKGIETTGSSNLLNGYTPIIDAEVVTKLVKAKAIPLAKTTLDELGMGGKGISGHKGVTFNPYGVKHERIVGGSSCGSASVVACGYVPFALGSDTGDSVRRPASFAGLVGFKPTWGAISRYGLYAFMPSLDTVGYFTRSVKDAANVFEVVKGFDKKDATSLTYNFPNVVNDLDTSLKGRKICVINQVFELISNKQLISEFTNLITKMVAQGAVVDFVDFDIDLLKALLPTYLILSSADASATNANLTGINFGNKVEGKTYYEIVTKTRDAGFSPHIKHRFMFGNFSLLKENKHTHFDRALKARGLIVKALNELLKDYEGILLPATPNHAPKIGAKDRPNSEVENNYLVLANFGGNPSITVPLFLDEGLPIGVNLTCKPFDDATALSIAYQIEKITGLENLYAGGAK